MHGPTESRPSLETQDRQLYIWQMRLERISEDCQLLMLIFLSSTVDDVLYYLLEWLVALGLFTPSPRPGLATQALLQNL
jgi:hypothetical protein